MTENAPSAVDATDVSELRTALLGHVLPFGAWLLLMELLPTEAWAYALRAATGLGLLIYFRPWRWYGRLNVKHLPLAVGVGVLVCVIWVLPETAWVGRWPSLQDSYFRWGFMLPWKVFAPDEATPYAPEICGWSFAIVRLVGSAFVIAAIEEFFWRGFLYRWLVGKDFLKVDPGKFDLVIFLAVALLFGLEHTRWVVGAIAGLAYGWLMLRTRDIWAVSIAHMVTNLLLGYYVLATGSYSFW